MPGNPDRHTPSGVEGGTANPNATPNGKAGAAAVSTVNVPTTSTTTISTIATGNVFIAGQFGNTVGVGGTKHTTAGTYVPSGTTAGTYVSSGTSTGTYLPTAGIGNDWTSPLRARNSTTRAAYTDLDGRHSEMGAIAVAMNNQGVNHCLAQHQALYGQINTYNLRLTNHENGTTVLYQCSLLIISRELETRVAALYVSAYTNLPAITAAHQESMQPYDLKFVQELDNGLLNTKTRVEQNKITVPTNQALTNHSAATSCNPSNHVIIAKSDK